jgi:hypothetical protein
VRSKVADEGMDGICGGEQFVELWNSGSVPVNLANMILSDDNGPNYYKAYRFTASSMIPPGGFILGCKNVGGANFSFDLSFQETETVNLYRADLRLLDSKQIAGSDSTFGWVWQRVNWQNWTYVFEPNLGQRAAMLLPGAVPTTGHSDWLCGSSTDNMAEYGPCIATTYDSLELTGLPTLEAPGFAGVTLDVVVHKKDIYRQTIPTDSSSILQINSAKNSEACHLSMGVPNFCDHPFFMSWGRTTIRKS